MIRDEDLKSFRKIADWLENPQGRLWRQDTIHPVTYGRGNDTRTFGLFSLKHTDCDVSGSEYDFTTSLLWGRLPGDNKIRKEKPEPLVR